MAPANSNGFRKSVSKPLDFAIIGTVDDQITSCAPRHPQDPAALLPSPGPASRLNINDLFMLEVGRNPRWGVKTHQFPQNLGGERS